MNFLENIDLFSVGVAISAIAILGYAVFQSDRESITHRTFFGFSLVTIVWGVFNYLSYEVDAKFGLWFLRIEIFFAVFQALLLFQLFYVFPEKKFILDKKYKLFILPLVTLTGIVSLTPLVFNSFNQLTNDGKISTLRVGGGLILFALVSVSLVVSGLGIFILKTIRAKKSERGQYFWILMGALVMFSLIIILNFILPAIFNISKFVPLGAVFIFPFIVFSSYSILVKKLLGIKVIATEILTFILTVSILYEVLFAESIVVRIFRIGIFLIVLNIGILLIRSVRKEVEQRQKLQELTVKLEATNVKLISLDKLKTEFLSFASHQVKTPMIVVKGFAQLIYDGTYGKVSPQVKETSWKIKQSADKMIVLVNNILDLSKIEEGKMSFKFEDIDINKMVTDMSEELKFLASKKDLVLKFHPLKNALMIKADIEKMRQVFQNLIDNSIKYTPKGSVTVALKDDGDSILFSVIDTGIGLSKELQASLFQRFVRDEKIKSQIQGTGLGLYIAKQIVEAHKGKVWVESDGEGLGSRFFVSLPKIQVVSNVPASN